MFIIERDSMDRRGFLRGCAAVGAAGILGSSCRKAQPAGRKPNIIYILADDLGYGELGCYGQKKIKTPRLDRMAAEGMRFTDHYSGSTVCAPSRCCLLTGYHTGHAYVRGNVAANYPKDKGELPLRPDDITVAEILQKAGYKTGGFGKWGNGRAETTGAPRKQGFDEFFGYLDQVNAHFYYPDFLWDNGEKVFYPANSEKKHTYSHDEFTRRAMEFIRKNRDENFFVYIPYTIPHAELTVPADSLAKYEGEFPETPYEGSHYCDQARPHAVHAAMISRMDRDVGRIIDLVDELGLGRDTLIMFSSDNGAHIEGGADPEFFDSCGPFRGVKRDLYEGGIRVPMIARWPGRIEAGSVSRHISAFWDILPTCVEAAGMKPPAGIDGISMLPTLLGEPDKQENHDYLYWEFDQQGGKQALRAGKWKAVRLDVKNNPDPAVQLFDLEKDPGEENDVAAEFTDVTARMEKLFERAREPSAQFPMPALDKKQGTP